MSETGSRMGPIMRTLREDLRRREAEIIRLLGRFVRCESPSHDKPAVDRMAGIVAKQWLDRGAKVRMVRQKVRGDHVRAEIWLGRGRPTGQILVLGHLDTVYPLGTLEDPFSDFGRVRLGTRNIRHESGACHGADGGRCPENAQATTVEEARLFLELR